VGNKLGKEAELLSFAKVVCSAATVSILGCRTLGLISGSWGAEKVVDA
jgi:hypothetical protein